MTRKKPRIELRHSSERPSHEGLLRQVLRSSGPLNRLEGLLSAKEEWRIDSRRFSALLDLLGKLAKLVHSKDRRRFRAMLGELNQYEEFLKAIICPVDQRKIKLANLSTRLRHTKSPNKRRELESLIAVWRDHKPMVVPYFNPYYFGKTNRPNFWIFVKLIGKLFATHISLAWGRPRRSSTLSEREQTIISEMASRNKGPGITTEHLYHDKHQNEKVWNGKQPTLLKRVTRERKRKRLRIADR